LIANGLGSGGEGNFCHSLTRPPLPHGAAMMDSIRCVLLDIGM